MLGTNVEAEEEDAFVFGSIHGIAEDDISLFEKQDRPALGEIAAHALGQLRKGHGVVAALIDDQAAVHLGQQVGVCGGGFNPLHRAAPFKG